MYLPQPLTRSMIKGHVSHSMVQSTSSVGCLSANTCREYFEEAIVTGIKVSGHGTVAGIVMSQITFSEARRINSPNPCKTKSGEAKASVLVLGGRGVGGLLPYEQTSNSENPAEASRMAEEVQVPEKSRD